MKFSTTVFATASVLALGLAAVPASAAVIGNGNIFLGVNSDGSLNDSDGVGPSGRTGVGLFDGRTLFEATYDGCTCEGWGVADFGTRNSMWANTDYASGIVGNGGMANVTGFSATTFSATSVTQFIGDSAFQVVHQFLPSISPDLYRVGVTITNTGMNAISDLVYRRVMDWDIEPTPFSEYVTIQGVRDSNGDAHPNVRFSSNDGFASGDPLAGESALNASTVNTNFTDNGTSDHGALFDFEFGSLAAGDSRQFSIYYGAALSEELALTALRTVGAEVYSLGQAADSINGQPGAPGVINGETGEPAGTARSTFIFAFDIDNDGTSVENPLLPTFVDENGGFNFTPVVRPNETVWIDPLVSTGYIYAFTGAKATSVEFENLGDADGYSISFLDGMGGTIMQNFSPMLGLVFDFTAFVTGGVSGFTVTGIDAALGLDPTDTTAFKTGLTFDVAGPTSISITQTPITTFVGGGVPEPATWAMMMLGFGAAGGMMRYRRRRTSVSFA